MNGVYLLGLDGPMAPVVYGGGTGVALLASLVGAYAFRIARTEGVSALGAELTDTAEDMAVCTAGAANIGAAFGAGANMVLALAGQYVPVVAKYYPLPRW
ncbi:MAG: hypothetical protein ACKVPX_06715 [Myxococcaceae bacterium]